MRWKRRVNEALLRATGYQLTKPPAGRVRRRRRPAQGERLVTAPAFVLSSVRSGSTLLRVVLNSHSEIASPHELHLKHMHVRLGGRYTEKSLTEAGLAPDLLQYLLWDRVLHRELAHSGKRIIVNKTPSDVFIAERILSCWPDARFIFLLRHPLAIANSRLKIRSHDSRDRNLKRIMRYCLALEAARETYPGLTVRYEDLTTDPERETRRICAFLGVSWEPGMLDYGAYDHGSFRPGLGDWNDKIRSGRIQPAPLPPPLDDVPDEVHRLCVAWGYLPQQAEPTELRSV